MTSNSDREKYKKYKALAVQLNGKYLKHKNMNKSLREQLNTLQNGGFMAVSPSNPVIQPSFQGSTKEVSQKNYAAQNSDAPMSDIASEELRRNGLYDSE